MGKFSRDKGARMERSCVAILQAAGLAAERIPLSGAAGGSFCGDLTVPILGTDARFECKSRASGFKFLYENLGENFGLIVKQDRCDPLVVMPLQRFAELAREADTRRLARAA